jgi:single-stranded-DNA-specific exonuclease
MLSAARPSEFREHLALLRDDILLVSHNDADGLSAAAILARALPRVGRNVRLRILGRGENPWSAEFRAEVAASTIGGIIATDLGIRAGAIRVGCPTILIDHHVPAGVPDATTVVISGFHDDPIPTSSLLAYRCAARLGPADDLIWLASLGIVGDMAESAAFPEMQEARQRYGVSALRKAAALINAARRSAKGDASPALALLLKAESPQDALSHKHPETAVLEAARDEVRRATEAAKRVPPKVAGPVALIMLHSPCQIHLLVAQAWRGRLKDRIVIAANTGYRPGWIHFAARTDRDQDLIAFLRDHAPSGADESYGSGHRRATGGALRPAAWNAFARSIGFPDVASIPTGDAA